VISVIIALHLSFLCLWYFEQTLMIRNRQTEWSAVTSWRGGGCVTMQQESNCLSSRLSFNYWNITVNFYVKFIHVAALSAYIAYSWRPHWPCDVPYFACVMLLWYWIISFIMVLMSILCSMGLGKNFANGWQTPHTLCAKLSCLCMVDSDTDWAVSRLGC